MAEREVVPRPLIDLPQVTGELPFRAVNPIATFWTAAQMLEHLGEAQAAARLMQAVERVTESGILTPDVGGKANTQEVTTAVCEAIAGANIL